MSLKATVGVGPFSFFFCDPKGNVLALPNPPTMWEAQSNGVEPQKPWDKINHLLSWLAQVFCYSEWKLISTEYKILVTN
jgi:hypothetical protein